ncbi:Ig-like domain-containing protein [Plantactinospora sp. CA-294935]|uniref:Ig-like domain-containing protein n=1 Tax=Plantactinospora sp. CA-294935 TaxID=3240012 RepID=UPI003D929A63
MSKAKSLFVRTTVALSTAAIATLALAGLAGPAQAESPVLGTVALAPTGGSVHDNPFVTAATTSAACPTGFGENAALKVGPPGGPYSPLARIGGLANYDQAPFTLAANRSLATALGAAPADGTYEVAVSCSGTTGTAPKDFSTLITVTGDSWAVKNAAATTTRLTAKPGLFAFEGQRVTLTATVRHNAAGSVEFFAGSTSVGTAPVTDGRAVLTSTTLPTGLLQLKATFTPDDPRLFVASTSQICYLVIG